MIYRFKLVSDEASNFSREIEISPEATFLDFRNAILDSVGYTKDEMNSFFICDDDWHKNEEITLEDMGSSSDQDVYLMDDTPIADFVEDEGQKLIFVFDYMTERSFFLELKEIITGRSIFDPICTKKLGKAPAQSVSLDEFEKNIDTKAAAAAAKDDFDLEFYGDADFNEDELPEGFDDMMTDL